MILLNFSGGNMFRNSSPLTLKTPNLKVYPNKSSRALLLLLATLFLTHLPLQASSMEVKKRESNLSLKGGMVAKAGVKGGERDGEKMRFKHWSLIHSRSDERFLLPLGINYFTLGVRGASPRWDAFADLSDTNFSSVVLGVGMRLPNASLFENNLFFDLTADIDTRSSSYKDTLLLGKLFLSIPKNKINWTLGVLTVQGRLDRVYAPIIGMNYTIDESWSLRLMLPRSMQLCYHDKESHWHLSGQVEANGARYRFKKGAENARGAWAYKAWQAGLKAQYVLNRKSDFTLSGGTNLLGKMSTYNSTGSEIAEYDFDPSAFVQAELLLHW